MSKKVVYKNIESGETVELLNLHFRKEGVMCNILTKDDRNIYVIKEVELFTFNLNYVLFDPVSDNVNQDIIKLIESGYEFKSFFGDTVDGKNISLALEE